MTQSKQPDRTGSNSTDDASAHNSGKAVAPAKRKPPKVTTSMTGDECVVEMSGDLTRLKAATGGGATFAGLVVGLTAIGSPGKAIDDAATNFGLGFVDAMKPRDPVEALILGQMAAVHRATMEAASRLNRAEFLSQQQAAETALNKLARTFAAQAETLKRYRSKGRQTVRVERVNVSDGGQAIVGALDAGGRGDGEK